MSTIHCGSDACNGLETGICTSARARDLGFTGGTTYFEGRVDTTDAPLSVRVCVNSTCVDHIEPVPTPLERTDNCSTANADGVFLKVCIEPTTPGQSARFIVGGARFEEPLDGDPDDHYRMTVRDAANQVLLEDARSPRYHYESASNCGTEECLYADVFFGSAN